MSIRSPFQSQPSDVVYMARKFIDNKRPDTDSISVGCIWACLISFAYYTTSYKFIGPFKINTFNIYLLVSFLATKRSTLTSNSPDKNHDN